MSQGGKLLSQLENAVGKTEHVVALIFDIRGFTNFCKEEGDSVNIATFVKRIYIKVLSEYFPNGTFYKPTGDGMLIVFRCTPGKECETAHTVVENAVKLVKEFAKLCIDDKLVYFKTPTDIGVGISRGSACCISSKKKIIDYSGRPLNLAARLCEKARPYGVVFDESVGTCLLKKDIAQNYLNDKVFLKGLTGKEPIRIYFTKGTVLPSSCKKPLDEPDWNTDAITITTNELESFSVDDISIVLTKKPLDTNQILAKVNYPLGSGTGWQS